MVVQGSQTKQNRYFKVKHSEVLRYKWSLIFLIKEFMGLSGNSWNEQESSNFCLPGQEHLGEEQNVLLQNKALWHEYYFELKAMEKQQIQGKAFFPAPICLKVINHLYYCHWRQLQTYSAEMASEESHNFTNQPLSFINFPHVFPPSYGLLPLEPQRSLYCHSSKNSLFVKTLPKPKFSPPALSYSSECFHL